jgi:hypothetical protein
VKLKVSITSTNNGNSRSGVDSNTLGCPGHFHGALFVGSTEEIDALDCDTNGQITSTSGNTISGAVDGTGVSILSLEGGNADGVIKRTRDEVVSLSCETTDLIGVSLPCDVIVVSGVDVPPGNN